MIVCGLKVKDGIPGAMDNDNKTKSASFIHRATVADHSCAKQIIKIGI